VPVTSPTRIETDKIAVLQAMREQAGPSAANLEALSRQIMGDSATLTLSEP